MSCKCENSLQEFPAMRIHTLLFIVPLIALSACSGTDTTIGDQNKNPLTASRYGDELADTMANLIISNDPVIKDAAVRKLVDSEILRGKKIADEARVMQKEGWMGQIIAAKEEVVGYVLHTDGILYVSSDFMTSPGPSLRVFLTTVVDPRDVSFPDATAIDLGALQAAYGPQQYGVQSNESPEKLRTFVLYDTRLKRIYGFAQLSQSR